MAVWQTWHRGGFRSAPLGRPRSGVGVKKINGPPYTPPPKSKTDAAPVARAILDSPDRAESKLALATVAGPGGDYELATTSYTFVCARVPRGVRAQYFPQEIATCV